MWQQFLQVVLPWWIIIANNPSSAFVVTSHASDSRSLVVVEKRGKSSILRLRSSTVRNSNSNNNNDEFFQAVQTTEEEGPKNDTVIAAGIAAFEKNFTHPSSDNAQRFDSLLGLYDVSYTKTSKPNENPVGGQWTRKTGVAQKLLQTRRAFQHILPVNATGIGSIEVGAENNNNRRPVIGEAVNVISLDALWKLMRVTIILRGDAVALTTDERNNATIVSQPLSSLAVRALFDAPRIILGKQGRLVNLNIGPKTSVLLDALYCDTRVRIGMGGTSGTRFVFLRCADDDPIANEFRALLARTPTPKKKAVSILGAMAACGLWATMRARTTFLAARLLGGAVSTLALLLSAVIVFSGGGIERDDRSVKMREEAQM